MRNISGISVTRFFVFVAAFFGVLLITLIPPMQSPDENSHFKKAYVIADGQFFPRIKEGVLSYKIEPEVVDYITKQSEELRGKIDERFSYNEFIFDEKLPQPKSDKQFYTFSTVSTNPIAHIVPALGVLAGKVVAVLAGNGAPSVAFFVYFARLFNLIFYIAMVAYSIHIIPIMKRTMCLLGLMPMAMYLAVSPSYDTLLNGISFLLIAKIFQLAYSDKKRKLNQKDIVLFSIIMYLFIVIKPVYVPLFLFLTCLPKECWGNKKELFKHAMLTVFIIVGLSVAYKLPEALIAKGNLITDSLSRQQLSFILQNPIRYIGIFFSTIINYRGYYVNSLVGNFGQLDTDFITVITYFYLFWVVISGWVDISLSRIRVNMIQRFTAFVAIGASVFGIYLAMYLFWTVILKGLGVGADTISGVQGRYFIPLILGSFLIVSNKIWVKNKRISTVGNEIVNGNYIVSIAMLGLTIVTLLLRFWC